MQVVAQLNEAGSALVLKAKPTVKHSLRTIAWQVRLLHICGAGLAAPPSTPVLNIYFTGGGLDLCNCAVTACVHGGMQVTEVLRRRKMHDVPQPPPEPISPHAGTASSIDEGGAPITAQRGGKGGAGAASMRQVHVMSRHVMSCLMQQLSRGGGSHDCIHAACGVLRGSMHRDVGANGVPVCTHGWRTGDLCPDVLDLGLHNSLAEGDNLGFGNAMCRLTVFAPFWVDNRTGFDLHIKDLDVPAPLDELPFLSAWEGGREGGLSAQLVHIATAACLCSL